MGTAGRSDLLPPSPVRHRRLRLRAAQRVRRHDGGRGRVAPPRAPARGQSRLRARPGHAARRHRPGRLGARRELPVAHGRRPVRPRLRLDADVRGVEPDDDAPGERISSVRRAEMSDVGERKAVARTVLELGMTPIDYLLEPDVAGVMPDALLAADLNIPFPPERNPRPRPIDPRPVPSDPLPAADVIVVTWTAAEVSALADVL